MFPDMKKSVSTENAICNVSNYDSNNALLLRPQSRRCNVYNTDNVSNLLNEMNKSYTTTSVPEAIQSTHSNYFPDSMNDTVIYSDNGFQEMFQKTSSPPTQGIFSGTMNDYNNSLFSNTYSGFITNNTSNISKNYQMLDPK